MFSVSLSNEIDIVLSYTLIAVLQKNLYVFIDVLQSFQWKNLVTTTSSKKYRTW